MLLLMNAVVLFGSFVNTQDLCTLEVSNYCYSRRLSPTACKKQHCPGLHPTSLEDESLFQKEILKLHNKIRSQPVYGVTAANMHRLHWDNELAQLALIAAHDTCIRRAVERDCEATPNHLERIGSNELALSADFKIHLSADLVMEK
ncbi:venom allergen 5-like, partial [Tropilaelaps mercedesae]